MGTLFIPSRKDQRQGFVATHLASLPPRDTRLGHPQMRKLVPTCSQNTNVNKWSTNVNHHLCAMVKRLYTYMRVIHLIMKILANRYYANDSKSPIWAIHLKKRPWHKSQREDRITLAAELRGLNGTPWNNHTQSNKVARLKMTSYLKIGPTKALLITYV